MIDRVLEALRDELNVYLRAVLQDDGDHVSIRPVVESSGNAGIDENTVGLTVIGTEEERVLQQHGAVTDRAAAGPVQYRHPDVHVSLYVLFCANFAKENHATAWGRLSQVMAFFQGKRTFNHANTPTLAAGIEEFAVDHYSLTFEQHNYVWSMLGSKFLPSVLYRVRHVLLVDERTIGERPPVEVIQTELRGGL